VLGDFILLWRQLLTQFLVGGFAIFLAHEISPFCVPRQRIA
jgi:hypothetical protein